jgi:hypothetical protein
MANYGHSDTCPRGYRLLVQLVDETTESAARATLVRMFGQKGSDATLVTGTWQPYSTRPAYWTCTGWVRRPTGYRDYLPADYGCRD